MGLEKQTINNSFFIIANSKVDNNEDFDSLEMVNRDEEDRYFADSPDCDLREEEDDDNDDS